VAKINKYEQYLKTLEETTGKNQRAMEKDFKNEMGEMQGRHDRQMMVKENQMDTLDSNLNVLN